VNAERLHAIVRALRSEIDGREIGGLVSQLASALTNLASAPADPSYQTAVADARAQLDVALVEAPSNGYSTAWRLALDELGAADLLGERLKFRVDQIFGQNDLTPAVAAEQLTKLSEEIQGLSRALAGLNDGLDWFHIGAEVLEPGDFEIGFLIPRSQVHDHFLELGKEFVKLEHLLRPLFEIGTGSRPDLKIRSISSSAFLVYLSAVPAAAYIVAKTIESLVTSYEKILDLRRSKDEMAAKGMPDDALRPMTEYVNGLMEADIEALADELLRPMRESNEQRANELRKEVVRALNGLANRIDRGYGIEVRAGEIPPAPEDEEELDPETEAARNTADAVKTMRTNLEYLNLSGKPILELPEQIDEGGVQGAA
jgi:hypothetical protein